MDEIYLPVLHSFENNNVFTGSLGRLRFKITPRVVMATPKEVNMEASSLCAEYWYGPLCYEKSVIEGEKVFPMSAQGREDMLAWLTSLTIDES